MKRDLRVKICGLRTKEDAEVLNEVLPDFAGFIFAEGRKRYIAPWEAEELRRRLDPRIRSVGVFLDAPVEAVLSCHRVCRFDLIQLHGAEDNSYIAKLRRELKEEKTGIIKAIRIESPEDLDKIRNCEADLLLLDHGIGGTGERFDWSLAKDLRVPFLLAGGISAENVKEAVSLLRPWGVDVSSSLETGGRKDPEKIREFMRIVRSLRPLT